MKSPFKIITCDMGPNVFLKDVLLSLSFLFHKKQGSNNMRLLEKRFSQKFDAEAISFNSGRTSLMAILHSLGLVEGNEVLIQAYTCVAVPDALIWSGCKPVYVDIDENNFSLDPKNLERKINKKTKAIIIQHTFGIPAQLEEIIKIAKKHHLYIIEDCAHATGVKYHDKYLGRFGDAAFFSFGRDKMLSSVYGGMVITENQVLAKKLKKYQDTLEYPSNIWVFEQLLYNPLVFIIIQTYKFLSLGKFLHFLVKKLGILSKAVQENEKKGGKPEYFPKKMSEQLALLALSQLERLDLFNSKRLDMCKYYQEELTSLPFKNPPSNYPLLRYIIRAAERDKIRLFVRSFGIYLDSWYDLPIAPKGTDFKAIGYTAGSCPTAEKVAKESLNLPTNPNLSKEGAKKVVEVLRRYYAQK